MRGIFVVLFLAIVTLVVATQPASLERALHVYARQLIEPTTIAVDDGNGTPSEAPGDGNGPTDVPSDSDGTTDPVPSATTTDAASDAIGTTTSPSAGTTSPSAGTAPTSAGNSASSTPSLASTAPSPSNTSAPTVDPCEDICIAPRNLDNMCRNNPESQSCLKQCEPDTWENVMLPCLQCHKQTMPELAANITAAIVGHDKYCDELKADASSAGASASASASASVSGNPKSGSAARPARGVTVASAWGLVAAIVGVAVAL